MSYKYIASKQLIHILRVILSTYESNKFLLNSIYSNIYQELQSQMDVLHPQQFQVYIENRLDAEMESHPIYSQYSIHHDLIQ